MSKIVEMDVEQKIIAAFKSAIGQAALSGVRFESTWGASADEEIKGEETADDAVVIAVAVSSPSFANWTVPNAEVGCAIAVSVRREVAPNAERLADVIGPIVSTLTAWQVRANDDVARALSTEGFDVQGFRISAESQPPMYSRDRACWTVSRSFSLQGVVREV